jgi:hypothetical protein
MDVQMRTHAFAGVQAHFAVFPAVQSTFAWQTQFAAISAGVPGVQCEVMVAQAPAVQVSVAAHATPHAPQLFLSVLKSVQVAPHMFGQAHWPA